MKREEVERYLAEGLSLEQIGKRIGRDPSTVGYWVKKHGLSAVNRDKHLAKGAVDAGELRDLVDAGFTQREIATAFGVGQATVRYWLTRLGLQTLSAQSRTAPERTWLPEITRRCPTHGLTTYVRSGSQRYRCKRCRQEAVVKRRRKVKELLIQEAGGRCALCGYDRYAGALQFHHLDPTEKEFALSTRGIARSLSKAREEARKCVLLCATCHAEVEAGLALLP
jgi:transposase